MNIQQELERIVASRSIPADIDPLPDGWPPGSWLYRGIEDFVLQHGRLFVPGPWPKGVRQMAAQQCFDNAFRVARRRGLIYVEGFGIGAFGFPFPHGWCVTDDGIVLDPTWDDGREYFGVPFDMNFVIRTRRTIKTHSMLDNPDQGFPLLRSRSEEWRYRGGLPVR